MPDNRLEQDGLYGRINSLEEEIADLKYTNQKLYKDCVTFAKKLKKIQVSGILDEDVDGLKELNTQYAEETIETQNMREVSQANELKETLEDIEDELPIVLEPAAEPEEEELFADEIVAPSLETIQNTELANATRTGNTVSFKALKLDEPDEEPEVGPAMRNSNQGRAKRAPASQQQTRTSHRKGSPGRRVLRGILSTLLTLVLLLALISGIVGLFAHNLPDATIAGLRCYTVQNDAMAPNVKQTDVIVVKKVAMEKLQPSNVILSTYGDRSFGSVEAIETRDGANYIVAADNTGATYDVTADQYLGKAVYRIAGLGRLAKYALTHRINYFAVLASLALILIALLILFPSRKPRRKDQPKFGRDYNVEDFTI